jgi:hypothetical protein
MGEIVDGLEIGYAAINSFSNGFKLSCIALYGLVQSSDTVSPIRFDEYGAWYTPRLVL